MTLIISEAKLITENSKELYAFPNPKIYFRNRFFSLAFKKT